MDNACICFAVHGPAGLVLALMVMVTEAGGNLAKVFETPLVPEAVAARVDNIVGFSLSSFFC